jgi:hypothetical protein
MDDLRAGLGVGPDQIGKGSANIDSDHIHDCLHPLHSMMHPQIIDLARALAGRGLIFSSLAAALGAAA